MSRPELSTTLGFHRIFSASGDPWNPLAPAAPLVASEKPRSDDAERKRRERRAVRHERETSTIDYLVTEHAPVSMVTLTFEGDLPAVAQRRQMFHRFAESLRYHGLMEWALAVPHTGVGVRGDVHVLTNLHDDAVAKLEGIGGSNRAAINHNRRTANLPPVGRPLEEFATAAGFGRQVHWRVTDARASAYLLDPDRWALGRTWRSGRWTESSEASGSKTRESPHDADASTADAPAGLLDTAGVGERHARASGAAGTNAERIRPESTRQGRSDVRDAFGEAMNLRRF